MAGYIKIERSSMASGTYGHTAEEYHLSYVTGSKAWGRTFDGAGLESFLTSNIGLTPARATAVVNQVKTQGSATVPEVNVRETEAAGMGLAELPSN